MMYQSCHKNISKTHQNAIEVIQKCVGDLDAQSDKQRFIELYNSAYMLPKKFDFQSCKGDEVSIWMTLISVDLCRMEMMTFRQHFILVY